jgi:SAM-dependent methyltransferase
MSQSDQELRAAVKQYRQLWPDDGYFYAEERYVKTFRLLKTYYQGGRLADVGGWPGFFACTLSLLKLPVVLVDKDLTRPTTKVRDDASGDYVLTGTTTLLDKCRRHGVEPVPCDVEREQIPLADHSVDFVTFTEVIEHLRVGPLFALKELRRILRPGGHLLLSTPNLLSVRNRWSFLTGRADYDTMDLPFDALRMEERIGHPGHFRIYSLPELVDLLTRSGFRVLHYEYHDVPWGVPGRIPWTRYGMRLRLEKTLSRIFRPLRNTIMLVAARD